MTSTRSRSTIAALLLGLAALALPSTVRADLVFDVSLDTTNLNNAVFGAGGPYAIDFLLTSPDPSQANSVTITNITGVGAVGTIGTTGGASGSLTTSVSLTDTTGLTFADFNQQFTAGGVVTFHVDATLNVAGMAGPDNFSFSILDKTGSSIPTTDLAGLSFLNVDLVPGATPAGVNLFSATDVTGAFTVGPPVINAVPEPSSLALVVIGLTWLTARVRRRQAA